MFIAEKNIVGIEEIIINLTENEHKGEAYVARNPLSGVPALELDDGRMLSESRAICTYLEGLHPEPNLMGATFEERAFIEMADRRMELSLLGSIANCIRHTHPGLSALEQPQFHDFGHSQGEKMLVVARWLDQHLASSQYAAGDRFTIADITAFCALEFARGLMKFNPAEQGLHHLQAYRDRIAQRPSV
ncbi:MAG: glutathione S-transferase [Burkholderiaceae bacterium]|jgi:glutathione S-transferase